MSAEAAPRRYVVTVPGLLPLANRVYAMGLRERLRVKRLWREWTVYALMAAGVPALGQARVTFVRHGAGVPDPDAIGAGAMKWVIDALVVARVIVDDDAAHLRAEYRAERCRPGLARVDLVIEEWR